MRTVTVRAIVRVRVMVWVRVRVRVRLGDAVVRNAVGRKVGNPSFCAAVVFVRTIVTVLHQYINLSAINQ